MIGDYLMSGGLPYRVMQVCGIVDDWWMLENGEEMAGEPISITPKILEKIGFVKYIAGQYVLPKMVGEIFVCITPMEGLPNANGKWLVVIKNGYTDVKIPITYIHELQHALKICEIEKEIEL